MEKLKINVNLKTGKYVFDNGEEITTMQMKKDNISLIQTMKLIRDELVEEYGFSAEMISRVDPILYENLKEYDKRKGTSYTIRYLNIIAKEVDRNQNEPLGVYLSRASEIRKKAIQDTGIELNYVIAKTSEMKNMSLLDKLEVIRIAKKQVANGATLNEELEYDEPRAKAIEDMSEEPEIKVVSAESGSKIKEMDAVSDNLGSQEVNGEQATLENVSEEADLNTSRMQIPNFLQEVLDKKDFDEDLVRVDTKDEDVVKDEQLTTGSTPKVEKAKVQQTMPQIPKKEISRRKSIQASKKAMRESRKMKNVYKYKINQANKPKVSTQQSQKANRQQSKVSDVAKRKEIDFIPIKDGKMVGIDENRPSAIVKTFVIEVPKREAIKKQGQNETEADNEVVVKKERIVHRYTRKLKDKADSIRNKVAMSKDRFKRAATIAAAAAVVVIAGVITIPRVVATIPLGSEHASETIIQAYDGVEQVSVKGLETDAISPNIEISETSLESKEEVISYIRGVEFQSTGVVNEEETLSAATVQNMETLENTTTENIQKEFEQDTEKNDSINYLESVKIGSRMTIDSGKYFENPDGSGNYGRFENHVGEAKILSQIGIATAEGYIAVSSDDVSLLELKQKYPDAKFSYHFNDEEGHVLGWLTSESFENVIEQQVDDGMER